MTKLTLGTAQIINTAPGITVRYMNRGSFLVGEQTFGNRDAAIRFCRERGLRVL